MIILTIRTDKPLAEVGLFNNDKKLAYDTWQAHMHLSETIHERVKDILQKQGKDWPDIEAIVCFKGPGSFTGLRIGLSVANALAYSLNVPVIGVTGEDWVRDGISQLSLGKNDKVSLPNYGAAAHITTPKK